MRLISRTGAASEVTTLPYLTILLLLGRVALVRGVAAYSRQTFLWTICRSVRASVCPVHCGKTANRIHMPFGITGRTCPGMRQIVGFGDRSTGRGSFGGEFGTRRCPQGPIRCTCATAPRRGLLAKLLWADLFLILRVHIICDNCGISTNKLQSAIR